MTAKKLTKKEVIEQLSAAEIAHDPKASVEELTALLPEGSQEESGPEVIGDAEVGDPQLLRPVELPLVVKPAGGGDWKNEAQAEYARYLNAYAYKNPKKWQTKKAVLIARLNEIGVDETKIFLYKGNGDGIDYKDSRFQK